LIIRKIFLGSQTEQARGESRWGEALIPRVIESKFVGSGFHHTLGRQTDGVMSHENSYDMG
jgi:hypothetical protein